MKRDDARCGSDTGKRQERDKETGDEFEPTTTVGAGNDLVIKSNEWGFSASPFLHSKFSCPSKKQYMQSLDCTHSRLYLFSPSSFCCL